MARRDFSRRVIGLAAPDCLCGACRYYDAGDQGCRYEAPEPAGKPGLQRRVLPPAEKPSRPIHEPEKAA